MTHLKWQNQSPARTILQATDLFNGIFSDFNTAPVPRWTMPPVNILENDLSYRIDLIIPGFRKEDLNIQVNDSVLVCSVEKKPATDEAQAKFTRKEYSLGSFTRRFNVPDNVDTGLIKAQYENGIMSIVLPKKADEKPRTKSIVIE